MANRLMQDLGPERARFDIKALRPPTFERLQKELADAKAAGRPYHIVHFDGHGIYADLSKSKLADWLGALSSLMLGSGKTGKHGYLLFEHPSEDKMRPVDGQTLGQLLHDNSVPVLVLNACQSAMHEATAAPKPVGDVHDEVRAIGSLAQAVVDQGIPDDMVPLIDQDGSDKSRIVASDGILALRQQRARGIERMDDRPFDDMRDTDLRPKPLHDRPSGQNPPRPQ